MPYGIYKKPIIKILDSKISDNSRTKVGEFGKNKEVKVKFIKFLKKQHKNGISDIILSDGVILIRNIDGKLEGVGNGKISDKEIDIILDMINNNFLGEYKFDIRAELINTKRVNGKELRKLSIKLINKTQHIGNLFDKV